MDIWKLYRDYKKFYKIQKRGPLNWAIEFKFHTLRNSKTLPNYYTFICNLHATIYAFLTEWSPSRQNFDYDFWLMILFLSHSLLLILFHVVQVGGMTMQSVSSFKNIPVQCLVWIGKGIEKVYIFINWKEGGNVNSFKDLILFDSWAPNFPQITKLTYLNVIWLTAMKFLLGTVTK